jgi:hypothetical protein
MQKSGVDSLNELHRDFWFKGFLGLVKTEGTDGFKGLRWLAVF